MIKTVLLFLCSSFILQAQSYAPAAGEPGSTAISADSPVFVAWATGIEVQRGHVDISNPTFEHEGSNYATYGTAEDALGPATNSVVSLGDAGEATLTFETPITDGDGFDFAVFENSFSATFLELAFVEVSSDGVNYFRFPSHSETQTETQVGGFGTIDPTYINNLAGKYKGLFGTPFNLSDLEEDALLNKNNITHIKIIDVVGSIDPAYARYDSFGNAINDPFSTPFYSSGFDLDGIGVINQQSLSIDNEEYLAISIYPNPASNELHINSTEKVDVSIYDILGKLVISEKVDSNNAIEISELKSGIYLVRIALNGKISQHRLIKN
ncbi:cell surface protein [Winogradskyella psychrotolerans RS-3]|uniref:Cell surface protein n=1 Tax=Winogradskyella psychrotolerans RS-3 TaxID=641526 RepID=S7X5J4_9FLAO|nr:T9SS type A sorting domain-containing protein [Winogradskyella psychrotolerans]EPR74314.1 cell surface protein [Winogradskyella psychrotolerans RS-3]